MPEQRYFETEFEDHRTVAQRTATALQGGFARALEVMVAATARRNKILFFGNGGSAALAQHLAAELTVRFVKDRAALPALALAGDAAGLTAAGNDLGFGEIFARQIAALGQAGDVAVGISGSGNSDNVCRALAHAREQGLVTIGLGGGNGGAMVAHCDVALLVPSHSMARIQEMHLVIGHALCGALERALGLTRD